MLTQQEADALLEILKNLQSTDGSFEFPGHGERKELALISEDGRHSFIVDVNRKGYIFPTKRYTYQGRYRKDIILLRLDIEGPAHRNPDGTLISGNHLHIYREGFGDRIAFELPPELANTDDMYQTLIDFLVYFKTCNTDELNMQTVML